MPNPRSEEELSDDAAQDHELALQYVDVLVDKLDDIDRACSAARSFLHHLERVIK